MLNLSGRMISLAQTMEAHRRETRRIARKLVRVLPTIGCRVPDRLRGAAQ